MICESGVFDVDFAPRRSKNSFSTTSANNGHLKTRKRRYQFIYRNDVDGQFSNSIYTYLYEGGVMHDLGTLGGRRSVGFDINNSDQVVGYSNTEATIHAFMYSEGVMVDLGTLGGLQSYATAINDNGFIVGRSDFQMENNDDHAFLWEDGTMYDLHDLIDPSDPLQGLTLGSAVDINSRGDILSSAFVNGEVHALVLRRSSPVPEPSALILVFLGLSLLIMRVNWCAIL